jgi:chorismate mutase / prephenate dehydratase
VRVAYFGRPGSYAHQAATQRFGAASHYVSCPTHSEVIDAVLGRRAQVGVLPIENSVAGVVMETIDTLVSPTFVHSSLKIREHLELSPHLALLSRTSTKNIRRVYSHPYPLRYLARWIRKNLPKADVFETVSTSEAAQLASEQIDAAAIAGPHAAKIYGLRVLQTHLEKAHEYLTRFCVVASKPIVQTKTTHTALCFGLKHRPGALVNALSILAENNLNLTSILSRPLAFRTGKFQPHAHLFFVDVEVSGRSPALKIALKELKKSTTFLDVIGEYFVRN